VFSVTVFTALLGSSFQRQTFHFLWVSELSSASATSCNSQLTICLQTFSRLTHRLTPKLAYISQQPSPLLEAGSLYIALARTPQKTPLPTVLLLLHDVAIGTDRVENTAFHSYSIVVLHSHYLAMAPPF
jgi:hypothetical protein